MSTATELAVTVRRLRKAYGEVMAVADVSFEVRAGEILGLLGPNGSGKTTTVECLQGLRRADAGLLDVLGLDPRANIGRLRRLVGSQLQDSALPDQLKVWEALRLFSRMTPLGPPWERLPHDWGLEGQRNTSFGDLSGGQRQRRRHRTRRTTSCVRGNASRAAPASTCGAPPPDARYGQQLVEDDPVRRAAAVAAEWVCRVELVIVAR